MYLTHTHCKRLYMYLTHTHCKRLYMYLTHTHTLQETVHVSNTHTLKETVHVSNTHTLQETVHVSNTHTLQDTVHVSNKHTLQETVVLHISLAIISSMNESVKQVSTHIGTGNRIMANIHKQCYLRFLRSQRHQHPCAVTSPMCVQTATCEHLEFIK